MPRTTPSLPSGAGAGAGRSRTRERHSSEEEEEISHDAHDCTHHGHAQDQLKGMLSLKARGSPQRRRNRARRRRQSASEQAGASRGGEVRTAAAATERSAKVNLDGLSSAQTSGREQTQGPRSLRHEEHLTAEMAPASPRVPVVDNPQPQPEPRPELEPQPKPQPHPQPDPQFMSTGSAPEPGQELGPEPEPALSGCRFLPKATFLANVHAVAGRGRPRFSIFLTTAGVT